MPDLTTSSVIDALMDADTEEAARAAIGAVDSVYVADEITTAISAMIGTAGTALDTLGELSDALGDDANFASTMTTSLAGKAPLSITVNAQTDSYTLVLGDAGKYVRMNKGTAANLTVPANASVAFPTGTQILVRQVGAGQVTVVASGGVTINTAETLKLRGQHSTATLVKVGTDEWDLAGDLEAV